MGVVRRGGEGFPRLGVLILERFVPQVYKNLITLIPTIFSLSTNPNNPNLADIEKRGAKRAEQHGAPCNYGDHGIARTSPPGPFANM